MSKILIKNITIQNPFADSFIADILLENNKIVKIAENILIPDANIKDGSGKIITPGLIDRHIHGGYGCDFNTCSEDELQNCLINLKKHGVVAVLPTLMTDSVENINRQIALLKTIRSKGAKILGVHLEGVFINAKRKGIHPQKYILPLTLENLNRFDAEFIKVLTYAPELDKNGEFLQELINLGIIPSIGHSDASYDEAISAIGFGVKQVTHLFNAMRPIHHREPSAIIAAINNNDVALEIIADLMHVHKAVLEMIFKSKAKDKILLISDALPISYSAETEMIFGGQEIFYDGQKATSKDGVLAGSTLFLDDIYRKISDFVEFKDFIGFASKNITRSLGIKDFPIVEVGAEFDLLHIWDKF